jgi:hypothetical protein
LLLSILQKRNKKRKEQGYLTFLNKVKEETAIIVGIQKQLINQLVVLDEVQKKLLIIDRQDDQYSYNLFDLNELKGCRIKHITTSVMPAEKGKKSETYTTQIGLEIVAGGKNELNKLLVFYDHIEHNILVKAEKEKEASDLLEKIKKLAKI